MMMMMMMTFNGPLGKLCANDCHNLPPKSFSVVENPLEFHFGMKDMDSLSSDQRLLYEYTVGISRGRWTLDLHRGKLVH